MAFNSVLFFGDQTVEASSFLQSLLGQSKTSPALQRFFSETVNALRLEISGLPEDERQSLPAFYSALDLVEYCGEAGTRVILSTVLLCLAQLGDYIRRVEQDSSLLGRPPQGLAGHSVSQRRIVGFCTGLLPAAVAAVATNLSDLTRIACYITSVSLRLGLHVRRRSSLIEATSDSWSVVVSGASPAECRSAIDRFHRTQSTPMHKQVYTSSETPSNVTVSGPPSILREFVSTCSASGFRCSRLHIFGAFHAPHLPAPSAESIVGSSPLLSATVPAGTTLINPSSGSPYSGATLHDLAVEAALSGLQGLGLAVSIFGPSIADKFLRQSLKAAGLENAKIQTPELAPATDASDAIAITGMAGRFPGSDTLSGFWDTLVPETRWDAHLHVDPTGQKPNTAHSAYGCFLDRPGAFDESMFNISPRESMHTDPVQRLLLMTTYEALEMAGYRYDVKPDKSRIGTFIGIVTDDWREYNISQDVDMYFVTGGLRSFASGRLNYFFKFEGPSYVVDTACSSSGAAMELACVSLLSGKCDMAVAGGGSIMTGPNLWAGLSRGGFVSPTGGCKTFDETADGYCRGEGVGVVVLKRLADAIAEGDQILGLIRGIATNHSANAPSITQPHAPTQVSLYREVLRGAGLRPDQVGYVEMHGTGTQAGDVTEMQSVVSTFGPGREPDNPLYVGSVKANVGHGEGAAGVTGLIKSLMMFRENAIPPHAGIKTRLNPKLPPLMKANIRIASHVEPFLASEEPRRILISSFGATGGNTCLVVEEPPKPRQSSQDPRSHHVVAVSAKGQSSLQGNKQRLLDFLAAHPDVPLKDIGYTSTARRPHHALRFAFCVSSVKELRQVLASQLVSTTPEQIGRSSSKAQASVVFVFPGQGFNFCGLAKTLYHTCMPFRQSLTELDDMCRVMDLPSFIDHVLDDQAKDVSHLGPVQSHLAIVAMEIALARLLKSWGLVPSAVVGHSLGEYAALCTARVLTVADTLLLVGKRAQLVEELCTKGTHGMLVVQASADHFKSMIEGRAAGVFEIACFNGPKSIVVNGRMKTLEKIQAILQENHLVRSSYVSVPYSFHSAQLDAILEEYRQVAAGATFSKPAVPVASTLLGKMVVSEGTFSASYMAEQTRKPVQFEAAIKAVQAAGLVTDKTLFVETGPGAMCLSMTQETLATPCKLLPCLKSANSNWNTLSKIVAEAYTGGISVDWSEYHRQYKSCLAAVDLPSYHFNLKDFWIQYKGGVAALEDEITHLREQIATMPAPSILPPLPGLQERREKVEIPPISTCLHRVLVNDITSHRATVEFSTNLQEAKLRKLVDGHKVIGIALAPSSLYNEMALGAAQYLYERLQPGKPVLAMDLHDLVISSPMFLNRDSTVPQLVKISATMKPGTATAKVTVSSEKEHCRCTIDLETADWTRDWSRRRYLIQDRVRGLMSASPAKPVHHLLKDMVYKMFFPVTDYSSEYQSISEIYIDNSFREAAVRLDLRQTPEGSKFTFDPCWLDNIAQTAGFVLNSDVSNPEDMICMSTGCDTMRLSKAFTGGKQYLCHVRAEAVNGGDNLVCDVTVFDEESVVALGEGLRFKRIKKMLLQKMLGLSTADSPTSERAAPVRGVVARPGPELVANQMAKPVAIMPTSTSQVQMKTATTRAAPVPLSRDDTRHQQTVIKSTTNGTRTPVTSFENISGPFKPAAKASAPKSNVGSDLTKNFELPAPLIAGATTISEQRDYFREDGAAITREEGVKNKDQAEDENDDNFNSSDDNDLPSFGSSNPLAQPSTPLSSAPEGEEPWGMSGLVDVILDAIAKETGVALAEIGEDTLFADLGIDSLMSVAIIGLVKARTGEELPANLFSDCETVIEVRKMFGEDKVPNEADHNQTPPLFSAPALPPAPPTRTFNAEDYQSKAVLVQGWSRSAGPILFLVTDGGGSAAVYVQLPALAPSLTVYALDSPFMGGKEEDFFLPGVTIEGVASIYARAVRSLQPHGPYMVGGYSIGGVFAYEMARYLINTGDRVHSFLILDAACPRSLKGIIDVNVEVCQMMGMFDSISEEDQRKPLTESQKLHVAGCVRTAANFDPVPIKPEDHPEHVFCIWARIGFVEHLSDKIIEVHYAIAERDGLDKELNPEWLEWLEAEKQSFGPRGWEKLLGNNIKSFVVDGDHFSIMMRPRKLMKQILSTLDKSGTQPVARLENRVTQPKSGLTRPVIEEAYGQAITLAPQFAQESGCFDFLTKVYPAQRQLVLAFVTEAFAKLGCPLGKVRPGMAIEPAGILPKYSLLLNALYEILEDGRLLEWRNGKRLRTYRPVDKVGAQTLYERLVLDDPPHANTHQLLQVTASRLADFLTGAADPMQIFYGKSRLLLQEFYASAPMLVVASKLVTELLRHVLSSSAELTEILEVGAGLGGTTKYILDMLIQAGIPFKLTYTDISPSLTGAARQRYKDLPKGCMDYMTLDIEQQPPATLLGRFHAVISTNCIHATKSLTASCANARKMLRPGGFLAVVELTQRLFWLDLVFGLLEGWWLFEDGRKHCLADESFWKASLEAAGYSRVVYTETGEGYKPNPQVIVACTD